MIARALLRAHQLRKIGHGQQWLVERQWLSDGSIVQRINDGRPDLEDEWKQAGRWRDLDAERVTITREGWDIDDG